MLYAERKAYWSLPSRTSVRMKLTSFRMRDRVHVQDMDSVGLITPEIEASLSEPLLGNYLLDESSLFGYD